MPETDLGGSGRPTAWRLIRDPSLPARTNMARDEALLLCHEPGAAPVLRLYGWSPPALSLGRFQPWDELTPPPGADLVRRPSGGAAVFHREDEVTYAVVADHAALHAPGERPGPRAAYGAIHALLARALAALGVAGSGPAEGGPAPVRPHGLCYHQPTHHDLAVAGKKLVGSAQRRLGACFLQHGGIPRSPDPLLGPGSTSLSAIGVVCAREAVEAALVRAFAEAGAELREGALTNAEEALARQLERERYATLEWTRAIGARPPTR